LDRSHEHDHVHRGDGERCRHLRRLRVVHDRGPRQRDGRADGRRGIRELPDPRQPHVGRLRPDQFRRRRTVSMTRTLVALLSSLVLAIPSLAAAQDVDDATRTEAEQYMHAGVAAARNAQWEEAYEAFREAYQRVPSNRVLMNLAGAERQTSRFA